MGVLDVLTNSGERDRLAKRRELKKQIEEGERLRGEIDALGRDCAEFERQSNAAVQQHADETARLRARLETCDPDQRAAVWSEIEACNDRLDLRQKSIRGLNGEAIARIHKLTFDWQSLPLRSALSNRPFANETLLAAWFVAKRRAEVAFNRTQAANAALARIGEGIAYFNGGFASDWQCELETANRELAEAQAAAEAAHEAVIAE